MYINGVGSNPVEERTKIWHRGDATTTGEITGIYKYQYPASDLTTSGEITDLYKYVPVKLGFIILSIIVVLRIPEKFYLYKDKDVSNKILTEAMRRLQGR